MDQKAKDFINILKTTTIQPSGCWEWQGPRTYDGVGYYGAWPVHLFLWKFLKAGFASLLPQEQFILRTCRNPSCCCPWHLKAGSFLELTKSRHALQKARAAGQAAEILTKQKNTPWVREDFYLTEAGQSEIDKLFEVFKIAV